MYKRFEEQRWRNHSGICGWEAGAAVLNSGFSLIWALWSVLTLQLLQIHLSRPRPVGVMEKEPGKTAEREKDRCLDRWWDVSLVRSVSNIFEGQ